MDEKVVRMSQERYEELQKELEYLRFTKMPEIEAAIKEARGHGDLSENSEYDAAKDEQGHTALRIKELQKMIENAEIIDESTIDTSCVNVGVIVEMKNTDNGTVMTIKVTPEADADVTKTPMHISDQSPIGSALLGHKVGEKVTVTAPGGVFNYEILNITK